LSGPHSAIPIRPAAATANVISKKKPTVLRVAYGDRTTPVLCGGCSGTSIQSGVCCCGRPSIDGSFPAIAGAPTLDGGGIMAGGCPDIIAASIMPGPGVSNIHD